jgi:hypothetical protein
MTGCSSHARIDHDAIVVVVVVVAAAVAVAVVLVAAAAAVVVAAVLARIPFSTLRSGGRERMGLP